MATIRKSSTDELRIEIRDYKDKKYLDIRSWFRESEESDKWIPTKKGVTVPIELLEQFVDAVENVTHSYLDER